MPNTESFPRLRVCRIVVCLISCLHLSHLAVVVADEKDANDDRSAEQPSQSGELSSLLEQPIQEYFLQTKRRNGQPASLSPFRNSTHLSTEYGPMGPGSEEQISSNGAVSVDLADSAKGVWAGVWHRLVSPDRPTDNSLDFSRCFVDLVGQEFQPRCVGIRLRAKGRGAVKLEIKSPDGQVLWTQTQRLEDANQVQSYDWAVDADSISNARDINWMVEQPTSISVDSLSLLLEFPAMSFAQRVCLISYAKLARCYSLENGVVKDKAHVPVGRFDCVPTSGMFCLASCAAWRMGFIDRERAVEILRSVHRAMSRVGRGRGLLPHFIRKYDGEYRIVDGTEFSTVDTSLYYHGMLLAAQMLGEDKLLAQLKREIASIDFAYLVDDEGYITHGLRDDGETKLTARWKDFGGETVLVIALCRMAVGNNAKLSMDGSGHVFRGRGFIAELQSLFYPQFASDKKDMVSGVDWLAMRTELLRDQREYFPKHWPESAAARIGIHGLSAGESRRSLGYESNGTEDAKVALLHPHYMLMAGQLDPKETLQRLGRLQQRGMLPPWGMVENVDVELKEYLPMIGSLNASFEALGAYHLWAADAGERDEIHAAARECALTSRAIRGFFPD